MTFVLPHRKKRKMLTKVLCGAKQDLADGAVCGLIVSYPHGSGCSICLRTSFMRATRKAPPTRYWRSYRN